MTVPEEEEREDRAVHEEEGHLIVRVFVECDACGFREEVGSSASARSLVRSHAAHCKKAHKGVTR